jgi:hypothetical protein
MFQRLNKTYRRMAKACLGLLALFLYAAQLSAAELPAYPDPDTEKACVSPGESPQCAAKTFLMCSEKSVATCKLIGLTIQPDGAQHKDDGSVAGDTWNKPWTLSWTELLRVTHPDYAVWQIEGLREVAPPRLRGVPGSKRGLAGTHELMIKMVNGKGQAEKQSVFFAQKKGVWNVTGFAIWRGNELLSTCAKRKGNPLNCRYAVPGLSPWMN